MRPKRSISFPVPYKTFLSLCSHETMHLLRRLVRSLQDASSFFAGSSLSNGHRTEIWLETDCVGVKEMAVQEKYQFLTAQQVPSQYSLTEPEYSTDTVTLWKKSVLSHMTFNGKGIVFSSLPDSLVLSAVHFIFISAAVVIQRWRPFSVRVVISFPYGQVNP